MAPKPAFLGGVTKNIMTVAAWFLDGGFLYPKPARKLLPN